MIEDMRLGDDQMVILPDSSSSHFRRVEGEEHPGALPFSRYHRPHIHVAVVVDDHPDAFRAVVGPLALRYIVSDR